MAIKIKRTDYAPDCRFLVINKDFDMAGFLRISGLTAEMEQEEILEGGKNDGPHIVTASHRRHQPLVLERGVLPQKSWLGKLKPGMQLGTWMEIILLDERGVWMPRTFWIEDGIVTKCEMSGLDALGNSVLIEKIEIVHDGLRY